MESPLLAINICMMYLDLMGHFGEIHGKSTVRPGIPPFVFVGFLLPYTFLVSNRSLRCFSGLLTCLDVEYW